MTALEIVATILICFVALVVFTVWLNILSNIIKQKRLEKEVKDITAEIFKNIDNDIKELKRAEFFEDLERIKKESERDNNDTN